jgi:hypothetical protein
MNGVAEGFGPKPSGKAAKAKIAKTFHEWGQGKLHSGSKDGPVVKSQAQATAIALNQARRKG